MWLCGSSPREDRATSGWLLMAVVLSKKLGFELASMWGRTVWDFVLRQELQWDQMTYHNLRAHFLYEE